MKTLLLRTGTSNYFNSDFTGRERKMVESSFGPFIEYYPGPQKLRNIEKYSNSILITNTHTDLHQIPKEILDRTRYILHPNSGTDNLDRGRNLLKTNTKVITGNSIRASNVAHYVMNCIFNEQYWIKRWSFKDRAQFPYQRKSDLKILLLGKGHVGEIVYRMLSPLYELAVYDPPKGYNTILKQKYDLLIVACELNNTTRNFVNKDFIDEYLQHNFTLINPARGEIVSTSHLIEVLLQRPHAAAYLDVVEQEKENFDQLPNLKNLFLTPHIAGLSSDLAERVLEFEYNGLKKIFHLN